MRIIGGIYRGKKLFSPLSEKIRPTADKARESVFNILFSTLEKPWSQIRLADIFCGTGAFGLESISRGASAVTLVDLDISTAAKNAALFPGEKNKISLTKADAANLPAVAAAFDIIFLDAPYHQGLSEKALSSLIEKKWLAPDGICIVETAADEKLSVPAQMFLTDNRRYGIARFWFLRFK